MIFTGSTPVGGNQAGISCPYPISSLGSFSLLQVIPEDGLELAQSSGLRW